MPTITSTSNAPRRAFRREILCGFFALLFLFGIFGSARALDQYSFGTHANTANVVFGPSYFDFGKADSFSIAGWYKSDDWSPNRHIWGKWNWSSVIGYKGYALTVNAAGGLDFALAYSTGHLIGAIYTNLSLIPGQWYHIVATYGGCGVISCLRLYINGVHQTPADVINTLGPYDFKNSPVPFGFPTASLSNNFFLGSYDDIRIYSLVLDQTDVNELYNSGAGICSQIPQTYPDAQYELDEGAGIEILDYYDNKNGSILGVDWYWETNKVVCAAAPTCDAQNCYLCYTEQTCLAACGSGRWYNNACHFALPPTPLTDNYISIDTPTENQVVISNQTPITGGCKYPAVEVEQTGGVISPLSCLTSCRYQLPVWDARYFFIQEIIVDGYTTSAGRAAGYARVNKQATEFAGITREDAADIRVLRYNGDEEFFPSDADLSWWYSDDYIYFPTANEPATGHEYPKYRYWISYSWPYENRPATLQSGSPPSYQYNGTKGTELSIIGDYDVLATNLTTGAYALRARTYTTSPPYLYSQWTSTRNFSVAYGQMPAYTWQDFDLNAIYKYYSPFDQPSKFLQGIFGGLQGVLAPIMNFVSALNSFFSTGKAIEYAGVIVDKFKEFISYTKLFDNIIGGYPITWGLLILIFIYIALFVVNSISKVVNLIKP